MTTENIVLSGDAVSRVSGFLRPAMTCAAIIGDRFGLTDGLKEPDIAVLHGPPYALEPLPQLSDICASTYAIAYYGWEASELPQHYADSLHASKKYGLAREVAKPFVLGITHA